MATLHVAHHTARTKKVHVTMPQLQRAMTREARRTPEVVEISEHALLGQLALWNSGYRGPRIFPSVYRAMQYVRAFPMGH